MNLSNYGMGDRLAVALSKAICGSDLPLITLQVSNNRLSTEGTLLLLQSLDQSKEVHASLVELDISRNKIGLQACKILRSLLAKGEVLATLNLSQSRLDDVGVDALAQAWLNNDQASTRVNSSPQSLKQP